MAEKSEFSETAREQFSNQGNPADLPAGQLENLLFETILKNSQDSIYFKDLNCRFVIVNKSKAEKHGVSDPNQMAGKTDFDYFPRDIAQEIFDSEKKIMESGVPVISKVEKLKRLDGKTTWSSSSKYPLHDPSGKLIGIWGISRDITDLQISKEALLSAERKLDTIIANISDVITITDIDGIITYMSAGVEKQFGWSTKDLIGKNGLLYIHPDDRERVVIAYHSLIKNRLPFTSEECRYLQKDGSYIPVQFSAVNMLSDAHVDGVLINYRDISDRKKREDEIFYLSYHDAMTGLYNRAFFSEECHRLDTRRQMPISIIMGDVNGLKLVNDAFGHAEGDKLIIECAQVIMQCCRKEDIVARIGGDEFCILLPKTSAETANLICDRIYNECAVRGGGSEKKPYFLRISLGHAKKTDSNKEIELLIKDAEELMYRHKLLDQKSIHSSLISSIKATMTTRTHETEEHSERMIIFSGAMGKALSLPEDQRFELDLLSRLHDIGKISIEEYILTKPEKLTENEWFQMKLHPEIGCRIAQSSPDLIGIAYYILCHHERWDGQGYPQNLSGENIPLLSRIIAIADSYDAMTQERPYRKAMTAGNAIAEIKSQAGKQFDPALARIFIEEVLGVSWE